MLFGQDRERSEENDLLVKLLYDIIPNNCCDDCFSWSYISLKQSHHRFTTMECFDIFFDHFLLCSGEGKRKWRDEFFDDIKIWFIFLSSRPCGEIFYCIVDKRSFDCISLLLHFAPLILFELKQDDNLSCKASYVSNLILLCSSV